MAWETDGVSHAPLPRATLARRHGRARAVSAVSRHCSLSLFQQTVIEYLLEVIPHRFFKGGIGHAQICLAV